MILVGGEKKGGKGKKRTDEEEKEGREAPHVLSWGGKEKRACVSNALPLGKGGKEFGRRGERGTPLFTERKKASFGGYRVREKKGREGLQRGGGEEEFDCPRTDFLERGEKGGAFVRGKKKKGGKKLRKKGRDRFLLCLARRKGKKRKRKRRGPGKRGKKRNEGH